MIDPCKYERLYKDDPITNEPEYDDPIEVEDIEDPEEHDYALERLRRGY